MIETIKSIFSIKASVGANRLIFYFQKLPLIGKLLKDNIYREIGAKKLLAFIAAIVKLIINFSIHILYLFLAVFLPTLLLHKINPSIQVGDYYVHILFCLSFISALFTSVDILDPSLIKFICVRIMKMRPRNYILAALFIKYASYFLLFTPILMLVTILLKLPFWWSIILGITATAFRFFSTAIHLFVYAKKNIVLNKTYLISLPGFLLATIAAYVPPVTNTYVISSKLIISIPFFLLCILLGILSIVYILNYTKFREAVELATKLDNPMYNVKKIMKESKFKDVEIKEKDLTRDLLHPSTDTTSHGYDYLNKVFFKRHRRMIVKPAIIRVVLVILAVTAAVTAKHVSPSGFSELAKYLLKSAPIFVFVMYLISTGEKICRAMFYNCDISLLRYAFYRNKKVILKNFGIRLKKVVSMNLIPAFAIDLGIVIIIFLSGITYDGTELLLLLLTILCLSVFFSVHHLFMYYIFQPFTIELNIKNPFYKIINGIVYFISYICLQLETAPAGFSVVALIATLLYIGVALLLVYTKSWKTFKVK